jgi:hypothetical protein
MSIAHGAAISWIEGKDSFGKNLPIQAPLRQAARVEGI